MKWRTRTGTKMSAIVLVVLLSVSGCSTLKGLSSAIGLADTASNGIDAELTVGQKQEAINTHVGESNSQQQAEEITNYVDNIPPMVLFMLILGWLLPSPSEMWRGLTGLFTWGRNK